MKKRGFTMVELMIVIAVIAVLASIIMPKMSSSRAKSSLEACKANLKLISTAAAMYMTDNGDAPASGNISNSHILVTQGYLKSAPTCPTRVPGTLSYQFGSNTARYSTLDYYVICLNTSGLWHNNLPASRPAFYMGHGFLYN